MSCFMFSAAGFTSQQLENSCFILLYVMSSAGYWTALRILCAIQQIGIKAWTSLFTNLQVNPQQQIFSSILVSI